MKCKNMEPPKIKLVEMRLHDQINLSKRLYQLEDVHKEKKLIAVLNK